MATLKFTSLLILVILTTFAEDCKSISTSIPPTSSIYDPPLPAIPTTPDPSVPAPYSYPPVSELAPNANPPEPVYPKPYHPSTRPSRGIKAAYWPSFNAFPASSIDTSYFTHIYYAFLLPDPITYVLNVTQFDQIKIPEFINAVRSKNPPVKTLLSIGGAGGNSTVFSKLVSNKVTRTIFIYSTIEVARKYGFDGVDLDWEFPENDEDMSNLGLLYKKWRKVIVDEARACGLPRLLLTSAVYYASRFTYDQPRSYPTHAIRKYLDWISPMCFDYHGSWENFTGLHSALYDPNTNLSTSFGIGSWIQDGVPPHKIVMGLPLYGRTWKLQDPYVNGVGAPALGVGPGDGVLVYSQIVDFNYENKGTVVFDGQYVSYYSYDGDTWIGYDDVMSVRLKIRFAQARRLGGYFFWALGQDKSDWTISRQASNAWGYP